MKKTLKYSYTADALRILAIIGVVAVHVSQSFVDYPPYFHGVSWWFANLVDSFARVSAPLFIMLSGVLILDVEKTISLLTYFTKRIKRVGIPLLTWSIIYLFWRYFYWYKTFTPSEILKDFLAPNIYYHLYFLYVILGLYIIAPLLKVLMLHIAKKSAITILGVLFLFVSILFALNKFLPDVSIAFNGLTLFFPYIPYFVAGHYLWQVKINRKQFWIGAAVFVVLFLFTAVANLFNMISIGWTDQFTTHMVYDRYFYEYFSPNIVLMSCIAFVLIKNISTLFLKEKNIFWKKCIPFLSPFVLGIYLLHPMMIDAIERYIPMLNLAHITARMLPLLLSVKFILVLLTSFVVVFIGKKIKYLRGIFG